MHISRLFALTRPQATVCPPPRMSARIRCRRPRSRIFLAPRNYRDAWVRRRYTGVRLISYDPNDNEFRIVIFHGGEEYQAFVCSIRITRNLNAISTCALDVVASANWRIGLPIAIIMYSSGGEAPDKYHSILFRGTVERIESSGMDAATVYCADWLRWARDSEITQEVNVPQVVYAGSHIGVRLNSITVNSLLSLIMARQPMVCDIGTLWLRREVNFGNANRLRLLQDICNEYNLGFYVDYSTGMVNIFRLNAGRFLNHEPEGAEYVQEYRTEEGHNAQTGVIVNYRDQRGEVLSPVWEGDTRYLGDVPIYYNRIERHEENRATTTVYQRRYVITPHLAWSLEITHTRESVNWNITATTVQQVEERSDPRTGLMISRITDVDQYTGAGGFDHRRSRIERWETRQGAVVYTVIERESDPAHRSPMIMRDVSSSRESGVVPPRAIVPRAQLITEDRTVLVGKSTYPLEVNANYISGVTNARNHADWLMRTEVRSGDASMDKVYVLPSLHPGLRIINCWWFNYRELLVEQVQTLIDFENLELVQSIRGRLIT